MFRTLRLFGGLFLLASSLAWLQGCSSTGHRGDNPQARQEVVMNAIAQIGTPYRYGGTAPSPGFDCSGLVQYTHQRAGIAVPRSTREQRKASYDVSRSRLRPGDLVFFKTGFRQYHVGIVVDDGRFVHAPSSSKTVQITRLDTPYWRKRFTGGGSFIN